MVSNDTMKIEDHLKNLKESLEVIEESVLERQKNIGFNNSVTCTDILKILLHKRYFIDYLRIIKYYKLNLKWNINRDNKIFALLKIP